MQIFYCDYCDLRSYEEKHRYTRRLWIEQMRFNVIKCRNCGLVCLFPQPTGTEQLDIYNHYIEKGNRTTVENNRQHGVYDVKISRLQQLTSGRRLLDVGAGLGTFVRMASEAGFEALGIEYEQEQCEQALVLNGTKLHCGLLENMWNELGKFDVIHLHHVLEHTRSPRQILEIIYDLLHPGAILLIEVPNQFFNIAKEVYNALTPRAPAPKNPLHHLYFFAPRTLRQLTNSCGYEEIELNQFRERSVHMPFWERIPKNFYRWSAKCLGIGAGSFIEMYLRKSDSSKNGTQDR